MDPKKEWPVVGDSNYPHVSDPEFKNISADDFYRMEYIERLKSLNDIDDWED
jgi:hypothetical protein